MSFHFNKITLTDWLVYGGKNEIPFPRFASGRNLVVFNGQNGYGKTSLLKAMRFVFDRSPTKAELLDLWNESARAEKEGMVEVSLEFSLDDKTCLIARGADFRPWGQTIAVSPRVRLVIDGHEECDQVEDKIQEILPRECLEFVFFDGAEISRYAQKRHEEGVRDAIEKTLGIPAVRNLRSDLDKVVSDLEEEQQSLLAQSQAAQELVRRTQELQDDLDQYAGRREEHSNKRDTLQLTYERLQKEAEELKGIEKERDELRDKQKRRADLEEDIKGIDGRIAEATTQTPLIMLQEQIRMLVEELRAKQAPSKRGTQTKARLAVIRELLDADDCLCGREVSNEIRDKLKAEVGRLEKLVQPQAAAQSASDLHDLMDLAAHVRNIAFNPSSLLQRRSRIHDQMQEIDTDIADLRAVLSQHGEVEISEVFTQLGSIEHQIAETSNSILAIDNSIGNARKELDKTRRELSAIGENDSQARGVTRTLETTEKIRAAVSELVDTMVQKKRSDIQAKCSEVFSKITNKPEEYEKILVDHDYSLQVLRKDGSVVENDRLSAGEKEVLAYSFITALNLASREPAPFVMDTPFGHLDSQHRSGLLRSLPELQVQAMLLATDRDLPPSERDTMDKAIAKEFLLERNQRKHSTSIREES